MADAYLTDDEIAHVTHPLTQGAARCKYLRREYGLHVRSRPDGQPIVARSEWDAAMLSKERASPAAPSIATGGNVVDFEAMAQTRRRSKQPA